MHPPLSTTPLFCLALTLVVYELLDLLYRWSGRKVWLNPLLLGVAVVISILKALDISYATYFAGAQFLHFLLGPVTVALAVPIYEQREKIREAFWPLMTSVCVGSVTGILTSVGVVLAWSGSRQMVYTLAPKSVTTPIAMGISEKFGGIPELTAVLVIITGIIGAATIPPIYRMLPSFLSIKSPAARGFAMGASSHGLGTARAFEESNETGTFAGLAMGLNGLATAVFVPILAHFLD